MRKNIWILSVFALFILFNFSNVTVQADDTKKAETITCAVSGETVQKSEAVGPINHKGTDFYFCCNSCVEKFKKEPEKYAVTSVCCGEKAISKKDAKVAIYQEKEYYFCNDKCKASFEKDPEAFLKKSKEASAGCQKECSATKKEGCCGKK
jgi:YHS domain-containing protein